MKDNPRKELGCHISTFYIKPQLDDNLDKLSVGCHISTFYIKPQPKAFGQVIFYRCHISTFYIKPQHSAFAKYDLLCCHISTFYIKPQLAVALYLAAAVVIYLLSTSNHNIYQLSKCHSVYYNRYLLHKVADVSHSQCTKLSKKFELQRSWPCFFLNLPPNIDNI